MFDEQPDGDPRRTRDVAGIRRFLTPQQMADEIVRLDAVIAGQAPNIVMGRLPPTVAAPAEGQSVADAARVLAEFAKTAPGRLPQRVQDAIALAEGQPGTAGVPGSEK